MKFIKHMVWWWLSIIGGTLFLFWPLAFGVEYAVYWVGFVVTSIIGAVSFSEGESQ